MVKVAQIMKKVKLIERLPEETKIYLTNLGELKFDLTTKSFHPISYSDNVDNISNIDNLNIKYWIDESVEFEDVVSPVIKFLCDPHTLITIDSTRAEIWESQKCTGEILDYVQD